METGSETGSVMKEVKKSTGIDASLIPDVSDKEESNNWFTWKDK